MHLICSQCSLRSLEVSIVHFMPLFLDIVSVMSAEVTVADISEFKILRRSSNTQLGYIWIKT